MRKSNKVWIDGQLIPWEQATVHETARVLHYGFSALEGTRAYALADAGPLRASI